MNEDSTTKTGTEESLQTSVIVIAWGLVVVGIGLAALGVCTVYHESARQLDKLAALGSYLQGAVGSVWSLAGLLFIFVAFLAQRRQLADQEKQFNLEFANIKKQNFESSFFQLLNLHSENVSRMRIVVGHTSSGYAPKVDGRGCFQDLHQKLKENFHSTIQGNKHKYPQSSESELWKPVYLQLYDRHQQELSHYFRTLYHVFKFVKMSDVPNKRYYTSLVRAQLSAYELVILFYNGITHHGEKFRPLMEEWGLFENLDKSLLLVQSLTSSYAQSAFE